MLALRTKTLTLPVVLFVVVPLLAMAKSDLVSEAKSSLYFGVAPLSVEGHLWAPVLEPYSINELSLKLVHTNHIYYDRYEDVFMNKWYLMINGQYNLLNRLTVGADAPIVWASDGDTGFGNIRLHARYQVFTIRAQDSIDIGLVVTPAIRIWLPTNAMDPIPGYPMESVVQIEPMLLLGLQVYPFSLTLDGNIKILAFDDRYDYIFGAADLVFGVGPYPRSGGFELVLEFNFLAELDDNNVLSDRFEFPKYTMMDGERIPANVDRAIAVAWGLGLRYRGERFVIELAYRRALRDCDLSIGKVSFGIEFGILFNK